MTYGQLGYAEPEEFAELEDYEDGWGDPFDTETAGAGALALFDRLDPETAGLMMDMVADMAAEADSEEEADAFLPILAKLAPMALKAIAPIAKTAFTKLAPKLSQSVFSAGRKMLQNFGQKGMAALPDIARGVARDSVQTIADGGQVSGRAVLQSAARHTLPFLQDPQQAQQAQQQVRRRLARRRPPQFQPQPYGQMPYDPQPYGGAPYNPSPYGPPPSPYGQAPYGAQDYGSQDYGYPQQPLPQPNYPQQFNPQWGG